MYYYFSLALGIIASVFKEGAKSVLYSKFMPGAHIWGLIATAITLSIVGIGGTALVGISKKASNPIVNNITVLDKDRKGKYSSKKEKKIDRNLYTTNPI